MERITKRNGIQWEMQFYLETDELQLQRILPNRLDFAQRITSLREGDELCLLANVFIKLY